MVRFIWLLTLILLCCVSHGYGQQQEEKANQTATSLGPGPVIWAKPIKASDKKSSKGKKKFTLFAKKKKSKKNSINDEFDRQIEEYYARMEQNVKRRKKEARLMFKPQYSDHSYFGHKRKPKKRKPGKRKFCKECRIVH